MSKALTTKKVKELPDWMDSAQRDYYSERDKQFFTELEDGIGKAGYPLSDVLQHFQAYVRRRELPKFLAQYELFKNIIDLPGCVVELGVYKGASFFTWAKLMETFCPGDRTRHVFGFDHFEGLTGFTEKDGKELEWGGKHEGGLQANPGLVRKLVELHNRDNLLPNVKRCSLVEGDIMETVPKFVKENPGLRISMLYFDVDLYEPTKLGLEHLYPLVVPGGVVAFDEYGMMPWEGESSAAEEYFRAIGEKPVFRKFPFSTLPHGYFIKSL